MRILLAGGGTAGHTNPLIATAKELLRRDSDAEILCVGSAMGLENTVIPEAGLKLSLIPRVPFPRTINLATFKFPFQLIKAISVARKIIKTGKYQVVVGFGGYISTPVYLAAKSLGLPIVIHEQNLLPGMANKLGAKFAQSVNYTFPGTPLVGGKCVGLPMKSEIVALDRSRERAAARQFFRINNDNPVLLVSGGSQGAKSINDAVAGALSKLLENGINVIHVLGAKNITAADKDLDMDHASYRPLAYISNMAQAYAAADLMLARCGAGTVVEVATVGLPAIFVPFPIGNGEQRRNAQPVVDIGGGILVEDAELSAAKLLETVVPLIKDNAKLEEMSRVSQNLMPRNAAELLADEIEQVVAK